MACILTSRTLVGIERAVRVGEGTAGTGESAVAPLAMMAVGWEESPPPPALLSLLDAARCDGSIYKWLLGLAVAAV